MYSYMSTLQVSGSSVLLDNRVDVPLKIIWTRVLMLSVRAERTDVSWRIMDKAMPDHLVLPLESFAAFTAWAAFDRTVVWSI
jgi:hypothetical protein